MALGLSRQPGVPHLLCRPAETSVCWDLVSYTCHNMVEMPAMGGSGLEATAVSLSVGAFLFLARAPLRVGRLPGCKDFLVRQASSNWQGGVPGRPQSPRF